MRLDYLTCKKLEEVRSIRIYSFSFRHFMNFVSWMLDSLVVPPQVEEFRKLARTKQ